ncbi:MAG: hypothetical protein NTW86_14160 [Candidatus Sumerlaeota bacterium]|nr:hypothetical protein [Candidatus Sumerlaeota bacterium]
MREDTEHGNVAFLGVDGGGTHTRGLAVDDSGAVLHACEGGPTNPSSGGAGKALGNLRALLVELREAALAKGCRPVAACVGQAGYDRPEDEAVFRRVVEEALPGIPALLTNDSHIGLVAGAPEGYGVMLVASTGCIAFGLARDGRRARADGFGHLLGDEGSAYAIGLEALRTVCREFDGRGPQTALTGAIYSHLRLGKAPDLIEWTRRTGRAAAPIAALAPVVFAAWKQGDAEAGRIVRGAIERLCDAAAAVRVRLFGDAEGEQTVPCVLGGGMTEDAAFFEALSKRLVERAPDLRPRRSARRPVEGAVDLARREWRRLSSLR